MQGTGQNQKAKIAVIEKGDNIQTWNSKECQCFLQYKIPEEDAAMPTQIDELRVYYQLIAHYWLPIPSPHDSSNDKEDTKDVQKMMPLSWQW